MSQEIGSGRARPHAARRTVLGGLAAALAAPGALRAQAAWPSRPIRIVVPFAPGGTTDISARLIATHLAPRIGTSVVVENKAGATTTVGAAEVARATPDGHTLLMAPPPFVIVQFAFQNLPYDPERDFRPVAMVLTSPFVLTVRAELPVRSVAELLALAKARPGVLTYGSPGPGSLPHVATELFRLRTGIDMLHVPYRGGGPALLDLAAGRIDVYLTTPPEAAPHFQSGRVRAIAAATLEPTPFAPGLPTIAATVPGYSVQYWSGLMAPAATPEPVVGRLNRETQAILAMPEVRQRLADLGSAPSPGSPDDFARLLTSERAQFRDAVAAAHIRVQ
jgi:tripartite-type tricarboxylate transporter receptor subunit TctC